MRQNRTLDFTPSCQLLKCQSSAIRCGDSSVNVARTAPPNISKRPPTRGSTCSGSRCQCLITPKHLGLPPCSSICSLQNSMCLRLHLSQNLHAHFRLHLRRPKCLARQLVEHWHRTSNTNLAQHHILGHEAACRSHSTANNRITLSQYNTRNLPAQ